MATQIVTLPAEPVVPIEATEAWWFLHPDAVEAVNPRAWAGRMPRQVRDVELIRSPQEGPGTCHGAGPVQAIRADVTSSCAMQ
jgi:hypothetical protein